jgi:hypothetical protein
MARAAALRSYGVLALCALLLAAPHRAAASDDDGDVVVLTEKNFDAIVKQEKIIVRAVACAATRARALGVERALYSICSLRRVRAWKLRQARARHDTRF